MMIFCSFQASSDFCVAPDAYVLEVAKKHGVVNQGKTCIGPLGIVLFFFFQ